MTMLTVVGKSLAVKGNEIIFLGSLNECKVCKVKNICFHLDKGSRYVILGVRDVMHECNVHEEGVKVVEIEKVPQKAVMDKKMAIEGSNVTFENPGCIERGCEHYLLCHPVGFDAKKKIKILSIDGEVECLAGMSRVKITLE